MASHLDYQKPAPKRAQSGEAVNVSWEVRNAGNGLPDSSFWYDSVVIKQADGRVLQTFGYRFISEDLSPSSSYQRSTTFFVRDIWTTGMYQIEVATDVTNTVFEFEYENNNEASQNMQIVQSLADLVISDANGTVSLNLISGESVLVLNWTVTNVGPGATGGDRIIDTVVVIQCNGSGTGSNVIDIFLTIPCLSPLLETRNLTISNAFDELDSFTAGEDIKLTWFTVNVGNLTALTNSVTAIVSLVSQKRHPLRNVLLTSALVPSDSLQVNISVRLPLTVNGIVSFTVSYEQDESVCVSVSPVYFGPYSINPPPTPSLEVSDVGWEILQSGTAIFVSWRVTNVGNTMIAESEWYDEVTIVSDIVWMETGQSYSTSKTLPVPQNAAGTVSVAVTSTYELVPGEPLPLGTAVAQSRVLLTLPEPGIPDLAVTNITGFPLNVSFGSFITIRYEVQNMGASTTSSSWTDCIYLVQPFFEELVVKPHELVF
ncbi:APHP domain protein [Apostichopus japonicus]|uniref:APHP domain protein n=1 Tax=Stichopus japonicus TaxID=307972 RepID=A0A2G8JZS2_STIJA|nr:APHP domain protein [Apostichopus japonicus]